MRRILAISVLFIGLLSRPILAQEGPVVGSLDISLWPEYDRPEVLVIYRGLMAEDTALPVPVEFRVPARVGAPTAVAYVGEGGQPFNQEYTTRLEGESLVIAFDLPAQGFQIEYYDELAMGPEGEREFTFEYAADYPTSALSLEYQVPPTAEAFALDPPADSVVQRPPPPPPGLTYHVVDVGAVPAGDEGSWTATYVKPGSDLTLQAATSAEPATQSPSASTAGSGGQDNSAVWIFLVAFIALVAVGAGAYWLGTRSQPPPPPPRRAGRRGSGPDGLQSQLAPSTDREAVLHCYACGAGLRLDSDYCYKCGTKVRTV
ncbi:hypothetical protein ACFLWA_09810 [Chloroflexota bacterium]